MSSLISLSIDLTKITRSRLKDGKYLQTTISINDETKYGNNVSMYESQSEEERTSKAPRTYIANGRVVWTQGEIALAEKEGAPAKAKATKPEPVEKETPQEESTDSLPF
tara:strand:- start:314 stop:640 length:327 start_codon:yes stop_codon:yes gene_type:complete